MKKIFALVIVSSLFSVGAMAKVGVKDVDCKEVLAKVKALNDSKKAASGQDGAPADSKDAGGAKKAD